MLCFWYDVISYRRQQAKAEIKEKENKEVTNPMNFYLFSVLTSLRRFYE